MNIKSLCLKQFPWLLLVTICTLPSVASAQVSGNSATETAKQEITEESVDGTSDGEEQSSDAKKDEKQKPKDHSVSASARILTSVGQGTFVKLVRAPGEGGFRKPTSNTESESSDVTMSFGAGLGYRYKTHSFSAGLGVTKYLTGGENERRDYFLGDLSFGYQWDGITFDSINTAVYAGAGLRLPTSLRSQEAHLYMDLSGSGGVQTTVFDSLSFSLDASLSKRFNKYTGPVATQKFDDFGNPAVTYRSNELVGTDSIIIGGLFTEWLLDISGGISWSIWQLNLSLGYTFEQGWSYAHHEPKRFAPKVLDTDGRRVVKLGSRRYSQTAIGSLGISYAPKVSWLKGLSFSLVALTIQPPKTPDNSSFNFPFWNFRAAAADSSAIRFTIAYRYSYGF